MSRQEVLKYAQSLARQFELEVSLEKLEQLPDDTITRIRGMPFNEFVRLIEQLLDPCAEKSAQVFLTKKDPRNHV